MKTHPQPRFREISPLVFAAGRPFRALEAVRAIKERDGWRIDQSGAIAGAWLPWEAINDVRYPDAEAAKRAIRTYAALPGEP